MFIEMTALTSNPYSTKLMMINFLKWNLWFSIVCCNHVSYANKSFRRRRAEFSNDVSESQEDALMPL